MICPICGKAQLTERPHRHPAAMTPQADALAAALPCAYCDSPNGLKWHRPACSALTRPAASGLREALEGALARRGHHPFADGSCEHRWRNRITRRVKHCAFVEGWVARAALAAAPAPALLDEHEPHSGNHDGYACGFSGPHCWACGEPWPCRTIRGSDEIAKNIEEFLERQSQTRRAAPAPAPTGCCRLLENLSCCAGQQHLGSCDGSCEASCCTSPDGWIEGDPLAAPAPALDVERLSRAIVSIWPGWRYGIDGDAKLIAAEYERVGAGGEGT